MIKKLAVVLELQQKFYSSIFYVFFRRNGVWLIPTIFDFFVCQYIQENTLGLQCLKYEFRNVIVALIQTSTGEKTKKGIFYEKEIFDYDRIMAVI